MTSEAVIKHYFHLSASFVKALHSRPSPFPSQFSETIYYRTYSRIKQDGTQEMWADTVIRVIEGVMSIRKNHYILNGLGWEDRDHQEFACDMATKMFELKWLPAGRGIWACGSNQMYRHGAASLYNCGATSTKDLSDAAEWSMDMSMHGVGTGFDTVWPGIADRKLHAQEKVVRYIIPDSREGWVESTKLLIDSWVNTMGRERYEFDYSQIRPAGSIIRGFGGVASGYKPLKVLHDAINSTMELYMRGDINETRCVADVMNRIGQCVVSGNIRRSAQIALGHQSDETFINLKNYTVNPERAEYGWLSNNSVMLTKTEDFITIPSIASSIKSNGEPGIINLMNIQKYGRLRYGDVQRDAATLINPCGEIPLEDKELCNLAEVYPTKNESIEEFFNSLRYATFYTQSVSLCPTHNEKTNRVIARNRRIGVSLSGLAEWVDAIGSTQLTRHLRDGYGIVRQYANLLAEDSGVRHPIRCTTVKPSGTTSSMVGVSSGMHYPIFKHAIRRIRIAKIHPVSEILIKSRVPHEEDKFDKATWVFEFIIKSSPAVRTVHNVSAWEQFTFLEMMQREWADNSVSCTIYFDPKKGEDKVLENMIARFIPVVKSVSMLPLLEHGAYPQMPYEDIDEAEYSRRATGILPIDWSGFTGSDGQDTKYCTNEACGV